MKKSMNQMVGLLALMLISINVYAADSYKMIVCGTLLDVESKEVLKNQNILVRNDVIEAMGTRVSTPAGTEILDLSDSVCMPGLMDMHVHIMINSTKSDTDIQSLRDSVADKTLFGLRNLQTLLNLGFTTIRIPGDGDKSYATLALRNAINRGEFKGPRMLVAPHAYSPTGGHGDWTNSFAYDSNVPLAINIVDGKDQIRRKLRESFKYGSDWVKIMATGGVMSQNDDPEVTAYSEEEFRVFAEETHRHKKKITAHAHGDAGARAAIEAGFDSIEHITLMQRETAKLMAEKGTVYVPTRYVLEWILAMGETGGITANNLAKANFVADRHLESIKMAYEEGVKMVLGSDPIYPMNEAIREFNSMANVLGDNWYVLQMGTINSAELLGLENEIGSLKVGKQADIVATPNNPIDDMENIEAVNFVMQGGSVIRKAETKK